MRFIFLFLLVVKIWVPVNFRLRDGEKVRVAAYGFAVFGYQYIFDVMRAAQVEQTLPFKAQLP
jgi:hypothetical protein